jgi:hypothetical protein
MWQVMVARQIGAIFILEKLSDEIFSSYFLDSPCRYPHIRSNQVLALSGLEC